MCYGVDSNWHNPRFKHMSILSFMLSDLKAELWMIHIQTIHKFNIVPMKSVSIVNVNTKLSYFLHTFYVLSVMSWVKAAISILQTPLTPIIIRNDFYYY